MPAKPTSSGPVHVFAKHAQDSTPYFLGHGEKAPDINEDPVYNDVICDVSGSVPLDKIYAGVGGVVSISLIRFDQDSLNKIKVRGRSQSSPNVTPGYDAPGARGSLVIAEGATFELWCAFGAAGKAAFVGMPPGYHFPACVLGPEGVVLGSVNARKVNLTIIALNVFTPTSTAAGFGAHTLYNHDMSGVAGVTLT